MAGTVRILSIDGGGIRGLIPAVLLEWLEARIGRPISETFHLIAGTSTGGILAAG
ncbi:MAG TPA: patatin, partial [Chromatiales bacterium]|nr:patatin [Chromatiales bacterium]